MKIQIDGTGMENKGAELMLYSILKEVEDRHPGSTVYYNTVAGDISKIDTSLDLRHRFFLKHGKYGKALFRRLHLDDAYFDRFYVKSGLDLILDGSGFRWGDQWTYDKSYFKKWESYYKRLKENGSRIILLPQAFGPFNSANGEQTIEMLNTYADLVIAREEISHKYLVEAGMDKDKTFVCTDFSLTVGAEVPAEINTTGRVCIIPNSQMIKHAGITRKQYLSFLQGLVLKCKAMGRDAFLLNHEGPGDLKICEEVNRGLEAPVDIITDLDARKTKGVISTAYAVISSRFHGVASGLNQSIPTLATSWSHKYAELFKDYGLRDRILDVTAHWEAIDAKVTDLLDPESNKRIHDHLDRTKPVISRQVENMWERVFTA